MKRIIASVKLSPGNRGYFDPLTGINLTLSNNVGYVREDDNLDNIRKAIKSNKIKLVGGKLPPAINIEPVKEKKEKIEKPVVKEKKVKKKEEPKKSNPIKSLIKEKKEEKVKIEEKKESEKQLKDGE